MDKCEHCGYDGYDLKQDGLVAAQKVRELEGENAKLREALEAIVVEDWKPVDGPNYGQLIKSPGPYAAIAISALRGKNPKDDE